MNINKSNDEINNKGAEHKTQYKKKYKKIKGDENQTQSLR